MKWILPVLLIANVHVARADSLYSSDDVHVAANMARHSREVSCIFKNEIGGRGYDPYTLHTDHNVYGPGGLATYGLLPEFERLGYGDKYSPYDVANYIDDVLDQGRGSNWSYLRNAISSGRC